MIVPIDAWVFLDARRLERSGHSVSLRVGSSEIAAPAQWLAGCIVLFAVFVPAYLVCRRAR